MQHEDEELFQKVKVPPMRSRSMAHIDIAKKQNSSLVLAEGEILVDSGTSSG
ncbi:MAG: hypothetical protein WA323_21045 [Candidatus Nitrosopolaris sp.]